MSGVASVQTEFSHENISKVKLDERAEQNTTIIIFYKYKNDAVVMNP